VRLRVLSNGFDKVGLYHIQKNIVQHNSRVVMANIAILYYFFIFTYLYHTLSCKKYSNGLTHNSVAPRVEATEMLPVNI
jgi:hypothetical protein